MYSKRFKSSHHTKLIIGAVVASLIGLAIISTSIFFFARRCSKRHRTVSIEEGTRHRRDGSTVSTSSFTIAIDGLARPPSPSQRAKARRLHLINPYKLPHSPLRASIHTALPGSPVSRHSRFAAFSRTAQPTSPITSVHTVDGRNTNGSAAPGDNDPNAGGGGGNDGGRHITPRSIEARLKRLGLGAANLISRQKHSQVARAPMQAKGRVEILPLPAALKSRPKTRRASERASSEPRAVRNSRGYRMI